MTKKIVVPVKALLFPLYHAKPVKNFSVGSGEMLYSKCLRPHDMDTVYSVLHLLGRKDFTRIDLVMLSVLSGQKKQNVSTSIRRSWEGEICFNNCFDNIPVLKMRFFDVSKERKGNQRVFVFSQNSGYLKLFSFGYCELDLDVFLSLSTLEKRCYEYFLYRKWRANNNPKKWDSVINFDKISRWIGLRDSNKHRRLEKTQKLLDKMKDIGVIKKGKKQDIAIVEFSNTKKITGEIPRFKKKKDPAHTLINQSEGRDTNLNESGVITQPPQESNAKKEASFVKSAQQQTREHFKQPVENCDTSQKDVDKQMIFTTAMATIASFKIPGLCSIPYSSIKCFDGLAKNVERYAIISEFVTENNLYSLSKLNGDKFKGDKIGWEGFNKFFVATMHGDKWLFDDIERWFAIEQRQQQAIVKDQQHKQATEEKARKQREVNQNKVNDFFKVWNKNISAKHKAYSLTVKKYGVMKNRKLFAKCVAEEFINGIFSIWKDKSPNFLKEDDLEKISEYIEQRNAAITGETGESRRKGVG